MQANIEPDMQKAFDQLTSLHTNISDDVGLVNPEDVKEWVRALEKIVNALGQKVHKSTTVVLDKTKSKSLLELIQEIQHTPAFSQALGSHQTRLMGLFHRIEDNLKQAESKVEPVKNIDPMNP